MKRIFSLKTLSIILYILAGLLFIGFIWSSYLSIVQPATNVSIFNIGGIESLFSVLSKPFAVAAAMLAILTLAITTSRTLRIDKQINKMDEQLSVSRHQIALIERQQEFSYQPDLLIADTEISAIISDSKHGMSSISFTEHKGSDIEARLLFANVGRAVAKNLSISYEFDWKKAISNLDIVEISTEFDIVKTINDITISSQKFKIGNHKCPIDLAIFHYSQNFLLNVSHNNSMIYQRCPKVILLLKFLYELIYKYLCKKYPSNIDMYSIWLQEFPNVFINISYEDVGNKLHKKRFLLHLLFENIMALSSFRLVSQNYKVVIKPEELSLDE